MRSSPFVIAGLLACSPQFSQPPGTATVLATLPGAPSLPPIFAASAAAFVTPTAVGIVVTNLVIPTPDVCAAPRVVDTNGLGDMLTGVFRIQLANDTGNVRIFFNAPVCTMDLDASAALGCISYRRCADAGPSTCVE